MKIDLTIGWDDLSPACKKKIEQLRKLVDNVNITYPNLNDLVWRGGLYPNISIDTVPCKGYPGGTAGEINDTNISSGVSSGRAYHLENPNVAVTVQC